MIFDKQEKQLVIKLDGIEEKDFLERIKEESGLESDASMCAFFEPWFENNEWDWIRPEEIAALTDAPIIGQRGEDDVVIEAYGWMQYAITSLLEELHTTGKVTLTKG